MPRKSKKLVESPIPSNPVADTSNPDQTGFVAAVAAPASEERDPQGRFAKNNAGGPGNPHARHCAKMLEMFRNAITDEEMYLLSRILFERASTGDMAALKMVWQYKLGKPLSAPNPDMIDRDEWDHFQKDAMSLDEMKQVLGQLPSRIGNAIVSAALPSIASTISHTLAAQLLQGLPAEHLGQPTSTSSPGAESQPAEPPAPSASRDSRGENPIPNGFLPPLDADGLPDRGLPSSLPARPSSPAPRPTPRVTPSSPAPRHPPLATPSSPSPIPNGKSKKGGKGKKGGNSLRNKWLDPIAQKCQAPKKPRKQRVSA